MNKNPEEDLSCRLNWIDPFFNSVKDRIFFRDTDDVLIVPPNQVYKLNKTGIRMLAHLSSGKGIHSFPGLISAERIDETHAFFKALQALYSTGTVGNDPAALQALESAPYDFNFTRLPILAEIAVTYRCNNSCSFCYLPPRNGTREKELSTKQIKKIIDIFYSEAKVPFFSFTGGEPLVRKDIETLVRYAAGKGITTNLVSNGTLCTPNRARALKNAGLGSAQLSVEAPEAGLHDTLVARKGAFYETLKGLENLQDVGIPVQTNTTLNAANAEAVLTLPGFLAEQRIKRFAVNLFIPVGTGRLHPELFLSYSDAGAYIRKLSIEAERYGQTFYWYSPTPYCIFNPLAEGLGNKSCAAADGLLSISPRGDILPCSSYHRTLGSILNDGFEKIWFASRARYFKEKKYAPAECGGCSSFLACQGACPLYWDFAGTGELTVSKTAASRGQVGKYARSAV